MGKTNSQDQSASSDSKLSLNASQTDISQPMMQFSYAYSDPYLNGLYASYGPHTMIQPQSMGPAYGRVPLPADLPEDGPIYVNAKQYHGILRRRQTRAKMEAQNKLVKTRRPYLHESRHKHALNRVRGTGGRFLSTKNPQHSDSHTPTISQNTQDSFHFNQQGNMLSTNVHRYESTISTTEGANADAIFQQQDGRYTSMPSHMVYNGNRHYASIVR
ncbi:hypothetical protein ACJIZ3_018819 [Penstemon smallii]|uniref:Nuclear transcription factor Y subunit n=1 Tax=Penstemon smallii TaxID=265156 RepID=A0ABD3T0W9_9LAMI